jgi:hypothetical protein
MTILSNEFDTGRKIQILKLRSEPTLPFISQKCLTLLELGYNIHRRKERKEEGIRKWKKGMGEKYSKKNGRSVL